jgi:purine-nucleoside phosphorylase
LARSPTDPDPKADLREAVRAVRARTALVPRLALALDRGLGQLAGDVRVEAVVPLQPAGELVLGWLDHTAVAAWTAPPEASGPERARMVRLARLLGADLLVLARRARKLDPHPAVDLAVVEDHVGFLVPNPLVGPNVEELGPRFPDLSEAYDRALLALALEQAAASGIALDRAIYAAHPDPNLATPAEYRVLREAGVAWVGEGGVQEVIVARHAGMRVLSLIGLHGPEPRLASLARSLITRM